MWWGSPDLETLRWHYGEAYRIAYWRGRWTAARRDNGRVLAADEPEQLLVLIRQDYAMQPVPRELT